VSRLVLKEASRWIISNRENACAPRKFSADAPLARSADFQSAVSPTCSRQTVRGRACGFQIRDTAQRGRAGRAATKGARLCPQDQPQRAGMAQRVAVKPESLAVSTRCGWCSAHSRAPKNRRGSRRFPQILIEFNFALLRFWTAPAERSGDGALDLVRPAMETPSSGAPRPQNPKRRGASLPAAVQDAGALATVARSSIRFWAAPPLRRFRFPRQVHGPNGRPGSRAGSP